jgi:hypothetical protein
MGEILPDGSIQGYFNKCKSCGNDYSVNIQGNGLCNCEKNMKSEKGCPFDEPIFNPEKKGEISKADHVKHLFFQVGMNSNDIVGEYFKEVYDKCPEDKKWSIEVQDFKNSDTRLSIIRCDNRAKAFVIETRTAFNDIEFIKGEVVKSNQQK